MQNTKKVYKNIYLDLDNTLWDFKTNSEKTLYNLIEEHFPEKIDLYKKFLSVYYPVNEKLWVLYRKGLVKKDVLRIKRFTESFKQIGVTDEAKINIIAEGYTSLSPHQTVLFPYSLEILEYLRQKGYRIVLLTNGFKEVQTTKIIKSKIEQYIDKMICSEDAGYQKPHQKIFEYALKCMNSKKDESIMIGDDLKTDIAGAKKFGMDCVFFNPKNIKHNAEPTFEINNLKELEDIL